MPRSAATRLAAGLAKGLFPPGGDGAAALGGLGAPVILAGGGCGGATSSQGPRRGVRVNM